MRSRRSGRSTRSAASHVARRRDQQRESAERDQPAVEVRLAALERRRARDDLEAGEAPRPGSRSVVT